MELSQKNFLLKEREKSLREKKYFYAHEFTLALCQEFFDELLRAVCEPSAHDPELKEVEETIEYGYEEHLLVLSQYNFLKKMILRKRKAKSFLERLDKGRTVML